MVARRPTVVVVVAVAVLTAADVVVASDVVALRDDVLRPLHVNNECRATIEYHKL